MSDRQQPREKFVVEGGAVLRGTVQVSGNKNEALPAIAAALLTDEPVVLREVPAIADVRVMLDLARAAGANVEPLGPHAWKIQADQLEQTPMLPQELCRRIRASVLLAGPLLARAGGVSLPPPGGDVIGRRRLDVHLEGVAELGARCEVTTRMNLRAPAGLHGASLFLEEQSVTGTENLIMAAVLARGRTEIYNAACEPSVQGLCRMLVSMGARIDGIGTNRLIIEGVDSLGGCEHTIGPDYIEVGSFAALAAVTGSEVRIEPVRAEELRIVLKVFHKLGIEATVAGTSLVVPGRQHLRVRRELDGSIPRIDDAPWPAFPTDLMSIAITAATQTEGTVLFFEKMFDRRLFFTDGLLSMGADIVLCDPHRVVVSGPTRLYGTVLQSPDIRAGMALLIAALAARGTSTIHNVAQIDRGYERIDERLRGLGAAIERVAM